MSILAWIVLGLVAGFIGSKIINKSGEGFFLDIILGIVGAVVGGMALQYVWRIGRDRPEYLQPGGGCDRCDYRARRLPRHQKGSLRRRTRGDCGRGDITRPPHL